MTTGMTEQAVEARFVGLPEDVARARQLAIEAVRSWGRDDLVDRVALAVSEIVTNAVVHSPGEVRLHLTLLDDGVRFEVTDTYPNATPAPREPAPFATGGRGLMITESISRAWGVQQAKDHKTVWVELAS